MLSAQLKLLLSAVHADAGIQVRRYRYFSPKTVGLDYKVCAGSGQPCGSGSNLEAHHEAFLPALIAGKLVILPHCPASRALSCWLDAHCHCTCEEGRDAKADHLDVCAGHAGGLGAGASRQHRPAACLRPQPGEKSGLCMGVHAHVVPCWGLSVLGTVLVPRD